MAGIDKFVYGKCFGVVKIAGVIETQYLSSLARESECMPWCGMEGMCRVVIGCMQPYGWKITSADPNGDQFTDWRWLLLEWGCLSTLRSL